MSGGAAWTKIDDSQFMLCGGAAAVCVASGATYFALDSTRRSGWTVGGGFDYAITGASLMPGWSVRVEYLYINFGSYTTFTNPVIQGNGSLVDGTYLSTKLTDNIVRVGFAYKFGNYAAPAAYR